MKEDALIRLFEAIRKAASQAVDEAMDFLTKPDATGKTPVTRIFDAISETIRNGKEAISPEAIKMALSYREICCETIAFKDLVEIIKREYKLSPGTSICVLKTENEATCTAFDIMACSAEKEILFEAAYPWCHLIVANPDPELLKTFGEKTMLVLK